MTVTAFQSNFLQPGIFQDGSTAPATVPAFDTGGFQSNPLAFQTANAQNGAGVLGNTLSLSGLAPRTLYATASFGVAGGKVATASKALKASGATGASGAIIVTARKTNKSAAAISESTSLSPGYTQGTAFQSDAFQYPGFQSVATHVGVSRTLFSASSLSDVFGQSASASRIKRATQTLTAKEGLTTSSTVNRKALAVQSVADGVTTGPIIVKLTPAASLSVRETASEIPIVENDKASATVAARASISGVGKQSEAATVQAFGSKETIRSPGNATFAALIPAQAVKATAQATNTQQTARPAATLGQRSTLSYLATTLALRSASLVAGLAKVAALVKLGRYGATTIQAQGTVTGNGAEEAKATILAMPAQARVADTGSRSQLKPAATLGAQNTIATTTVRANATPAATLGAKDTVAITAVQEKAKSNTTLNTIDGQTASHIGQTSVTAWLASELDQIAESLAARHEYGAAFIAGVAGLFNSSRVNEKSATTLDTKENEVGANVATARKATTPSLTTTDNVTSPGNSSLKSTVAPLATKETTVSTTVRIIGRPLAALATNAKMVMGPFRTALRAAFNFITGQSFEAPSPAPDYSHGETLENSHPRIRALNGIKRIRSLMLNHPRNRDLP